MSFTLGLSIVYMPNKNKYQLDSGLDGVARLAGSLSYSAALHDLG